MQNKNINLIRYLILKNCYQTKEGHVGSAFSILEILYIIFKKYINTRGNSKSKKKVRAYSKK